jgi:hypothetical protein
VAAWKHPHYTLGVEWEIHFARITPYVDGVLNVATSAAIGGNTAIADQRWVRWTTDHRYDNSNSHPPVLNSIVEVNLGPLNLSPGNHGVGSATRITAQRITDIVAHTKAGIEAQSKHINGARSGTDHCYGSDTMLNTVNAVNALCANTITHGGHELDLAPTRANTWSVSACWYDKASDAAMRTDDLVQANYLMPLSGTASKHWLDGHGGKGVFWDDARYKIARYSRRAAVNYLTNTRVFPAGELAALSDEHKADVLGVFHIFLHQFCYAFFAAADQRRRLSIPNSPKNMFGHLIKTNIDQVVKKLDPETADFIFAWYSAANFAAGTVGTNAPLNALFDALRDELINAEGTMANVAREVEDNDRVVRLDVLRRKVRAFDYTSDCCHGPRPHAVAADETCCTSPIGHRAPSAIRVGGGDGVLSVVVESRYADNTVTAAVAANNAEGIDTALAGFLKQHTWNGVKNKFYADHTA